MGFLVDKAKRRDMSSLQAQAEERQNKPMLGGGAPTQTSAPVNIGPVISRPTKLGAAFSPAPVSVQSIMERVKGTPRVTPQDIKRIDEAMGVRAQDISAHASTPTILDTVRNTPRVTLQDIASIDRQMGLSNQTPPTTNVSLNNSAYAPFKFAKGMANTVLDSTEGAALAVNDFLSGGKISRTANEIEKGNIKGGDISLYGRNTPEGRMLNYRKLKQTAQDIDNNSQKNINSFNKGLGWVAEMAGEQAPIYALTMGAGNAVNAVKSGSKLLNVAKTLVPSLSTAPYILKGMGSKYMGSVQSGEEGDFKTFINAVGSGYLESVLEKIGIGGYIPGLNQLGGKAITGSAKKALGNTLLNVAKMKIEEGAEELVNVPLERLLDKVTLSKNTPWFGDGGVFDIKAMGQAFAGGTIMGGLFGSIGAVSSISDIKTTVDNINAKATILNAVNDRLPGEHRLQVLDANTATVETVDSYSNALNDRLLQFGELAADKAGTTATQSTTNNLSAFEAHERAKLQERGVNVPDTPLYTEIAPENYTNEMKGAAKIANIFGREVVFYSANDKIADTKKGTLLDGKIYINTNTKDGDITTPMQIVAGHEVWHALKQDYPELWQKAVEILKEKTAVNDVGFNNYKDSLMADYRVDNLAFSDTDFWEEYASDIAGDVLFDEANIERIANQSPKAAQRIVQIIRDVMQKIRVAFGLDKPRMGMANSEASKYIYDLSRVESAYMKALTKAARQAPMLGGDVDGGVKNSIKNIGGENVVVVDNAGKVFANPNKPTPKELRRYLLDNFKGSTITALDGQEIKINRDGIQEYSYGRSNVGLGANLLNAKYTAGANLDEIVQAANKNYSIDSPDSRHGNFSKYGWDYKAVKFQVGNKTYEGLLNVAKNDNGNIFYDVNNIKEVGAAGSLQNPHINKSPISNNTTIAQNNSSVNTNISDSAKIDTAMAAAFDKALQKKDGGNDTKNSLKRSALSDKPVNIQSKAERYQTKRENNFVKRLSDILSIPVSSKSGMPNVQAQEALKPVMQQIEAHIRDDGGIQQETSDTLFNLAYDMGKIIDEEYYNQYKNVREEIRTTALQMSERDRADIPDFTKFRRDNLGSIKVVADGGVPVDTKYQELSSRYPDLFPADITHQADQLLQIADVVKGITKTEHNIDVYYGDNAEDFKAWAKDEFNGALSDFVKEMEVVNRYNAGKVKTEPEVKNYSVQEIKDVYKQISELNRKKAKAVKDNLLTEKDNVQVDRLLKGEIIFDELPKGLNTSGIRAVYEASKPVYDLTQQANEYKKQYKAKLREDAARLFAGSDSWNDKRTGFAYSRETMERNIRDIANNPKEAEIINDYLFTPVHQNEAEAIHLKNKYRDRVKALKLTAKESELVQRLGELDYRINELKAKLNNRRGNLRLGDLSELRTLEEERARHTTGLQLDANKINNAVDEFRRIYNDLFDMANDALIRNGYAPVEYRKGYFPHFTEDGDTLISKIAGKLGVNLNMKELPTDIAGITHTFRPGKQFFSNFLQRTGDNTVYDAVKGFDGYIEGIANVIYHTDDIQRLRAAEDAIRYKYSEAGVKEEIDAIREDANRADEDKEARIKELYEREPSNLSRFVQELRTYTDVLAGKKHISDRSMEKLLGRGMYNLSRTAQNQMSANMVGMNISSALTNLIPITQATAGVNTVNLLHGMKDTVSSWAKDDHFRLKSTFLTNRKGSTPLTMTGLQKVSNGANFMFNIIDDFTSQSVTRARYYENMKNRMSEADAILDADKWAAGLIGDRSKGAMPTAFELKNPIAKLFTSFQLEVNNQLSFLFKDVPRDKRDKGIAAIAWAIMKYMFGAWLYNELTEKLTGRRAALDPIGIIQDTYGDFTNEDKSTFDAVAGLGKSVTEQIPFSGALGLVGLDGAGRLPISSALPDLQNTSKALLGLSTGEMNADKAKDTLRKEAVKPLAYLNPFFGGGQLRKGIEGVATINAGGSYTIDGKGDKVLQFPANDKSAGAYIKAGLFGKYATNEGRAYLRGEVKQLSAKQTEGMKVLKDSGLDTSTAQRIANGLGKIQPDGEHKGVTNAQKFDYIKNYEGLDNLQRYTAYDVYVNGNTSAKVPAEDWEKELAELIVSMGETALYPKINVQNSITWTPSGATKSKTLTLNEEEHEEYKKTVEDEIRKSYADLIGNPERWNAEDKYKIKRLETVRNSAHERAKKKIITKYRPKLGG